MGRPSTSKRVQRRAVGILKGESALAYFFGFPRGATVPAPWGRTGSGGVAASYPILRRGPDGPGGDGSRKLPFRVVGPLATGPLAAGGDSQG